MRLLPSALLAVLFSCSGLNPDPCQGLACAIGPGTLELTLHDASTGGPVASPTFTDGTTPVTPTCAAAADAGDCTVFDFETFSIGAHTLTVSAPGHTSKTISFTIEGPTGCCGRGATVSQTVTL